MTAKTLCFASAKGGAGKTTMTATFGAVLAELGYKVLLVDCDEATNGLTLLYINEVNNQSHEQDEDPIELDGIFDRAEDITRTPDIVQITKSISVCPATYRFDEKKQYSFEAFSTRLSEVVSEFKDEFDFILFDAQAGGDPVSLAAMSKSISELVIIVSEYDPLSAAGVERLKALAGESLSFDRTWVLLNKMLPDFIESFSEFLSVSHYLPPVPWTADVVRAYARRELALDFETGNEFTLAVLQSVKSVPIRGLKERLAEWTDSKAASLRQPVETQYSDLEDMMNSVTKRAVDLRRTLRTRDTFRTTAELGVVFGMASAIIAGVIYLRPSTLVANVGIKYLILGSLGLAVATMFLFVVRLWVSRKDFEAQYELGRIERQRKAYEDRLQELEFLRIANSTELLDQAFKQKASTQRTGLRL